VHLADTGALDRDYVESHTFGFDERTRACAGHRASIGATAGEGLSEPDVARFFADVLAIRAAGGHAVFARRQLSRRQGTDKGNAIIKLPSRTGRIASRARRRSR